MADPQEATNKKLQEKQTELGLIETETLAIKKQLAEKQ